MTPLQQVGKMIKTMRIYRGLTQTGLAELAGITQPYVAQLEAGDRAATLDVLLQIASALRCTLDINLTPID